MSLVLCADAGEKGVRVLSSSLNYRILGSIIFRPIIDGC